VDALDALDALAHGTPHGPDLANFARLRKLFTVLAA
jgi:hypothetical protein